MILLSGYLMSGSTAQNAPSTYQCVDENPQYIHVNGESLNTDGALLYFIKPDCSGAQTIGHCPPYDATKQLTCVVCTR